MSTPTCPNCGAKFSHSKALAKCTKCGLPDEIAAMGPRLVARWKKMERKNTGERQSIVIGGSAGRKKNKHGRKGVAR